MEIQLSQKPAQLTFGGVLKPRDPQAVRIHDARFRVWGRSGGEVADSGSVRRALGKASLILGLLT